MKQLLIFDTWAPASHTKLNNHLLKILSREYKLIVLNHNNYYKVVSNNIRYINIPFFELRRNNGIKKRIVFTINFIISRLFIIGISYDAIIIMTYHCDFFLNQYKFLNHKVAIYLFEHYNVDNLINKNAINKYKKYAMNVHHIVFAPFIADYLHKKIGLSNDIIHCIHHPLFEIPNSFIESDNEILNIFAPGQSNDEEFVKTFVDIVNSNQIDIKFNLKFRTSEKINNLPSSIVLFSDYLSNERYVQFFDEADIILVFYPKSFVYRMASVIINGMTRKKVVIGNDIEIVRYFEHLFPNNCRSFSTIKQFLEIIESHPIFNENEYEALLHSFGDDNILEEIKNFI